MTLPVTLPASPQLEPRLWWDTGPSVHVAPVMCLGVFQFEGVELTLGDGKDHSPSSGNV